jgi:hypothetical protein
MALVTRKEIIKDIQNFLVELSKPFSNEDTKGGWTDKTRETAISFFRLLELDLNDRSVDFSKKEGYLNLVRGLDFWGVIEGPLFESALNISNKVRDISEIENGWRFWRRWFS